MSEKKIGKKMKKRMSEKKIGKKMKKRMSEKKMSECSGRWCYSIEYNI